MSLDITTATICESGGVPLRLNPQAPETIPPELLVEIFSHLNEPSDLCSSALVCRAWRDAVRVQRSWSGVEIEIDTFGEDTPSDGYRKLARSFAITDPGLIDRQLMLFAHTVELSLSSCSQVTDDGLAQCSKLRSLFLDDCAGVTKASFALFTNLHSLSLSGGFEVVDEDLAHLTRLKRFELFEGERITDIGLSHLSRLERLELWGSDQITDAGLASLENLREAVFSDCSELSDGGLQCLTRLQRLKIDSDLDRIKGHCFASMSKLESLSLNGCPGITDEACSGLEHIKTLALYECPGVTDKGLSSLKNLKVAALTSDIITGVGLAGLTKLLALVLNGCPKVSDRTLAQIQGLISLELDNCLRVSVEKLTYFQGLQYLCVWDGQVDEPLRSVFKDRGVALIAHNIDSSESEEE